jgi:uncharacterized membrane protein
VLIVSSKANPSRIPSLFPLSSFLPPSPTLSFLRFIFAIVILSVAFDILISPSFLVFSFVVEPLVGCVSELFSIFLFVSYFFLFKTLMKMVEKEAFLLLCLLFVLL